MTERVPAESEYDELMAAIDVFRTNVYYSKYREAFTREFQDGLRELFMRMQAAVAAYVKAKGAARPTGDDLSLF